jgi:hypothetical protein
MPHFRIMEVWTADPTSVDEPEYRGRSLVISAFGLLIEIALSRAVSR